MKRDARPPSEINVASTIADMGGGLKQLNTRCIRFRLIDVIRAKIMVKKVLHLITYG